MVGLYAELKLAPEDQIRLVNILPRNESSALACELRIVDLRERPEYVALSYTWGSPTPLPDEGAEALLSKPSVILLCRAKCGFADQPYPLWHQVLITENLYAFLLRARDNDSFAQNSYWIDAICIDQENSAERCHQVQMMGRIYRSAGIVHAWLGEEDDDTRIAFELIRALLGFCSRITERRVRIKALMDITPKSLGSASLTARLGPCADVTAWMAMANLFQRRYFTRAWIIQEIILGRKIKALCGSHIVSWEAITTVSEFVSVTPWKRWISNVTSSPHGGHDVPNLLDVNKFSNSLLYSLIRFRRFASTDPRDKVYSLLSITGESTLTKNRLVPVYGERSVAETYTLAAIQILEDSDDLLLLCCAEGDSFRTIPSLPTWVPDWSCARALGLAITGYKRFAAAGTLARDLYINEEDRCLIIKGFRLDDIVSSSETKEAMLGGSQFSGLLRILNAMTPIYHTRQSRSEVLWRTLVTDTAGVPPRCPAPNSYRSAYVSWITSKLSASVKDSVQNIKDPAFVNTMADLVPTEISDSSPYSNASSIPYDSASSETQSSSVDYDEFETIFSHALHLRLFLTGRGYLGVGSISLLEQDSIWVVPGCRVPLILREINSHTFQVVGGAYVHGFMQGEALESGPIFRNVTLV
ncbi:hypothetical protein COCSADRAFT_250578 [Bipolaris sorokiniana ND90Pr]|uniref:Heterokaryon incompatibility domain-containing protein n=1 Tax=Cochliobolus sativus (strain ND90Pr / ATCC 201652) TaxID=665912 RepID=M2QZ22_COCSN|nr:uncharacterized protein COCSADRAFT_250578 [Bipolaris sorokiniana ND90Pr]EMD60274.1 hypothetical protein COCSADRAFT_250578 [Bipolaris sorokiniana ND90Pr]